MAIFSIKNNSYLKNMQDFSNSKYFNETVKVESISFRHNGKNMVFSVIIQNFLLQKNCIFTKKFKKLIRILKINAPI